MDNVPLTTDYQYYWGDNTNGQTNNYNYQNTGVAAVPTAPPPPAAYDPATLPPPLPYQTQPTNYGTYNYYESYSYASTNESTVSAAVTSPETYSYNFQNSANYVCTTNYQNNAQYSTNVPAAHQNYYNAYTQPNYWDPNGSYQTKSKFINQQWTTDPAASTLTTSLPNNTTNIVGNTSFTKNESSRERKRSPPSPDNKYRSSKYTDRKKEHSSRFRDRSRDRSRERKRSRERSNKRRSRSFDRKIHFYGNRKRSRSRTLTSSSCKRRRSRSQESRSSVQSLQTIHNAKTSSGAGSTTESKPLTEREMILKKYR